jgi:hypothetical protein
MTFRQPYLHGDSADGAKAIKAIDAPGAAVYRDSCPCSLLTTAIPSPNLTLMTVTSPCSSGRNPAVEDVAAPASQSGIQPVSIADVRFIPLADLPADPGACDNASRVLKPLEEPSRIQVAMFNSAI